MKVSSSIETAVENNLEPEVGRSDRIFMRCRSLEVTKTSQSLTCFVVISLSWAFETYYKRVCRCFFVSPSSDLGVFGGKKTKIACWCMVVIGLCGCTRKKPTRTSTLSKQTGIFCFILIK
jgi:hypothetical protein